MASLVDRRRGRRRLRIPNRSRRPARPSPNGVRAAGEPSRALPGPGNVRVGETAREPTRQLQQRSILHGSKPPPVSGWSHPWTVTVVPVSCGMACATSRSGVGVTVSAHRGMEAGLNGQPTFERHSGRAGTKSSKAESSALARSSVGPAGAALVAAS
jgi:hypothetical protein